MPFSHHSHSGQFCGHAANTLEEIVLAAIKLKMHTFCLTEHMPRDALDFYPEECESGVDLFALFDAYYHEARRLQSKYAAQIQIWVGFEGEWIRPSSLSLIEDLLAKYPVDLFIGSVHHVHTIPIDYDVPMYQLARARASGGDTDAGVFADYFDDQYEMLRALRPPVVGHLDLIRLKSDGPERSFHLWPEIWAKIERNLRFVAEYGGVIELNSASLRKGMTEAYPQSEICAVRITNGLHFEVDEADVLFQVFRALGGRFTLSDDSHGVEQVGLKYGNIRRTLDRAGINELHHLAPIAHGKPVDARFPKVEWRSTSVADLLAHGIFSVIS